MTAPALEAPPRLRVDLFSGVRVHIDDAPVPIRSAKALALLVCLVLSRTGEERRDVLAERLWSRSQSVEHQRNSLKRDLKTLIDSFRARGFDGLVGHRTSVELDLARTDCDVLEALRAAEAGYAHAALMEDAQPFARIAADCEDVDPEFTAWRDERARALSEATARALDRALMMPDLDGPRRLDLARAAFNLDRTKQPAALALMQALEEAGDISGALRVYGALYHAHLEEHDEEPGGEILQAVQRLKLRSVGDPDPGGGEGSGEAAQSGPLRLRLDVQDALRDPLLRRAALVMTDQLGRRPDWLKVTVSGRADMVLQLRRERDDRVYLQMWTVRDTSLYWTETITDFSHEELAATARRLAVIAHRPQIAATVAGKGQRQCNDAVAETFALRLLISRPDAPCPPPEPGERDSGNPVDLVDQGWIELMHGRRRSALSALRQAAALDGGAPEVVGAAALGLALLGHAEEAVRLADRLAAHPERPGLRALRGTTLAICGDRRTAALCLSDLPEDWLLPRGIGAAMADLSGDRVGALSCIAPALARLPGDAESFCDWALRALPLPDLAEPMLLRARLAELVGASAC
ncbi:MAG: hypothetical protein D6754_02900 [Alphaproteobacteria bacterium]|nr:MAG: hypothetical protein D6754_02900 [Alphaproteobacteria bacterium]